MGIINVTPDSFSDGGRFLDAEAAIAHGLLLASEGADILDIGGESTRPGANPVDETEELRRVLPVIEGLAGRPETAISIDTVKPGVAQAAIRNGASVINDVAANRAETLMWRIAAESGAGYVAMHMQGTPQTMQADPVYEDVVGDVNGFFEDRLNRLAAAGVRAEQIALDVGIGFGKTTAHNLKLLRNLRAFTKWERPLVLGVSRKSFIGKATGAAADQRQPGSLACACIAVERGAGIIRTHDVAATRQAVRMVEAVMAMNEDVATDTKRC